MEDELRPPVSVVVATRNRPGELERCLASVRATGYPRLELIVVDSASSAPEQSAALAARAGARFVAVTKPGATRARNAGILAATGELVALTDDDAVVDPGWIDGLVAVFADPAVDVVVGPVLELGGSEPLLQPRGLDVTRDHARFARDSAAWFDRVLLGGIGLGANLAARRRAFDRVGFFRAGLGSGAPVTGDEHYFLLSAVAAGAVVANAPEAVVRHPRLSDERARVCAEEFPAYVLYIVATRPELWGELSGYVARRLWRRGVRRNSGEDAGRPPPAALPLRSFLRAPWRVARAMLADRAG